MCDSRCPCKSAQVNLQARFFNLFNKGVTIQEEREMEAAAKAEASSREPESDEI